MATHYFQPTEYHTTMGVREPVLHINVGDRVVTTTADASGRDATGTQITTPGNPQTGPFFIEGAEPGDVLVLHLERIAPNRSYGWTSQTLATNVVDPSYVSELFRLPKDQSWEPAIWDIDVAAGTATLKTPATKLGRLILPLAPMLGCFGVAPAGGQAIWTATSAEHGGNMDYRGFVSGVTVYFPVFVPGGLLFVGDGHAAQGDGEIAGTGIEISMDVEFSVGLVKDKRIGWPRGENAEYIFTVGNARPLDQAVQHATTEMIRWLQSDYGLDPLSVSLLLGQAVRYDLGNMFDPAYTMICKMPRDILEHLPK